LARPNGAPFRLCLITDRKLAEGHGGLIAACEAALGAAAAAGWGSRVALQLREKDLEARELYELALRLRDLCTRHGAMLIVNDRIDVALAANADGVHLPADSFDPQDARRLLGPSRLIGVSTHQPDEVVCAAKAGADFAVFGPVFAPLSKAAYGPARGFDALGAACRAAAIPVYALGGITAERVRELGRSPAGVAAIGAVFGADSPGDATKEILEALALGLGESG
jgi:thiamine-phosphate pyrophosphorylase